MMDGESMDERTRLVHGTPSYAAYNGKVSFTLDKHIKEFVYVHAHVAQYLKKIVKFNLSQASLPQKS